MENVGEFHTCETRQLGKSKRGRKPLPENEKQIDANIYATRPDIDFLLTWNRASASLAFAELIAQIRKFRPGGRFSSVPVDPQARFRPGTKTMLKKRIAALEAQLKAAGMEPIE